MIDRQFFFAPVLLALLERVTLATPAEEAFLRKMAATSFPLTIIKSLEGDSIDAFGTSRIGTCIARYQAFAVPLLNTIRIVDFQGRIIRVLGDTESTSYHEGNALTQSQFTEANGYMVRKYDDIVAVDVNEAGTILVAGHRSGALKVYELEAEHYNTSIEATELPSIRPRSFKFGGGQVSIIRVHKHAPLVAVGSVNGRIQVFSTESGAITHEFVTASLGDPLTSLTFHTTRLLLAAGTSKGSIVICDLCRNAIISTTKNGHESAVTDIKFIDALMSSSGAAEPHVLLVSGSRDKWIKVFSLEDCTSQIKAILPACQTIAYGKEESEEEIASLSTPNRRKKSAKLNNSRGSLWKALLEKHFEGRPLTIPAKVALRTNEEIEVLEIVTKSQIRGVTTDASWLVVTGGSKGRLRLWDLLKSAEVPLPAHQERWTPIAAPVRRLFKTPTHILATGHDGSLIFYDLANRLIPIRSLKGRSMAAAFHTLGVHDQAVSIYSCGISGALHRIAVSCTSAAEISQLREDKEDADYHLGCVSKDGSLIAVASNENGVKIFETNSGLLKLTIPSSVTGHVTALHWNNRKTSNAHLVIVSKDMYARIFQLTPKMLESEAAQELTTPDYRVQVSDKPIWCVALSPNDKVLATAGADKKVSLWKFPSMEPMGLFTGHKSPVTSLAFSPIEQIIASGSMDLTVKLWNLKSLEILHSLSGVEAPPSVLSYHRDGVHLVGGLADGTMKVWDTKKAVLLGTSIQHSARITDACWVPLATLKPEQSTAVDAEQVCLITCSDDGSINIWSDDTQGMKESEIEAERERRTEVSKVALLIAEGSFCEALRISLKWRRLDLFESVIKGLKEATSLQSSMELPGLATPKVPAVEDDEIEKLFQQFKELDLELLLMAAVHFVKKYRGSHFAHWLVSLVISQAHRINDLQRMEGFTEFVKSFNVRSRSAINRVESLKEKSFLIDILLNDSNFVRIK